MIMMSYRRLPDPDLLKAFGWDIPPMKQPCSKATSKAIATDLVWARLFTGLGFT